MARGGPVTLAHPLVQSLRRVAYEWGAGRESNPLEAEATALWLTVCLPAQNGGSPESRTLISPPCKRGAMPLGERTVVAGEALQLLLKPYEGLVTLVSPQ